MFLKRYLWFGLATIFVSLSVAQAFADECRGLVVKEIPPNTPDEGGSPIAVKQGTVINELHGIQGLKRVLLLLMLCMEVMFIQQIISGC